MDQTIGFPRPTTAALAELQARLSPVFGERLVSNSSTREHHGRGEGLRALGLPDLVAFPQGNEEVAAAVAACNDLSIPVIPFGAGTSLEGHVTAVSGGLTLDLSGMDQVLEVSPENLDCRVQAGVRREQLNAAIRDQGLFFPLDPGANATLGGMASTRASGTNAVRYGTMREVTLGLTVVTPRGEIIHTGGRARKSAAGYDLTRLYVGAEGTLGVITELRLRVFGIPEIIMAASCQFPDLKSAVDTVITAMQLGVPLARIELMDSLQMAACIRYSKLEGLAELPTLFLEFHGAEAAVAEQVEQMRAIAGEFGGSEFRWAERPEDRSRIWTARHDVYHANIALMPNSEAYVTDACVPIAALAECILQTREIIDRSGLVGPIVGHVGDGNFHSCLLFRADDHEGRQRAEDTARHIAELAISLGGTSTGEHGVGLHKLDLLEAEHGEAVAVMAAIKHALDPNGVMNPGKTIPPHRLAAAAHG